MMIIASVNAMPIIKQQKSVQFLSSSESQLFITFDWDFLKIS